MYTASPAYTAAIHAPGRVLRSRLTIAGVDTLDDSIITSMEFKRAVVPDSGLLLGTAIAQQVTIKLLDPAGDYAPQDFSGKDLSPSLGVEVADGDIEYVPMGIYIADQPVRSESSLEIVAYDRMVRAERPYVSALAYPSTMGAVLAEAASQSGLTLATGTIRNSGLAVPAAIVGATCRQIIGWAAECATGWACITRTGLLQIISLASSPAKETLTPDNYFPPMAIADEAWWADGVTVKVTPDDVGETHGTATRPWAIVGNPFLVGFPAGAINNIITALAGKQLWPYAAMWQANPALDPGDPITILDLKTAATRATIAGTETLTYNGGLRSALALAAPSAQQQATDTQIHAGKQTSILSRAYTLISRTVDSISMIVSNLVSDVEQHTTSIEQTAEAIVLKADDSRVDGLETRISSAEFALTPAQIKLMVGQIGANNMISNSGQFADTTYWMVSKDADTTLTAGPVRLMATDAARTSGTIPVIDLKVNSFSGGWCNLCNTTFQSKRFVPGQKYTISGRYYTNAALSDPRISISDTNGTNVVLPTTTLPGGTGWRDFVVTFAAGSAGNVPTLLFWARASEAQLSIKEVKLEVGETATAWSMSAEEAATRISSAEASLTVQAGEIEGRATKTYVDAADSGLNAAAAAAQTTANNAASAAATANSTLADMSSDNRLTPIEKHTVRKEWDVIAAEKDPIVAQANKFGNTVERNIYTSAFQSLANYLNDNVTWSSGVPFRISDANLNTTTAITGSTFRDRFKAYYDSRTLLLNVLAYQSMTRADAAQVSANEALLQVAPEAITLKVSQVGVGGNNLIRNGRCDFGLSFWLTGAAILSLSSSGVLGRQVYRVVATSANGHMYQIVTGLIEGNTYTISARVSKDAAATSARILTYMNEAWSTKVTKTTNGWEIVKATFIATATSCAIYFNTVGSGTGSGWTDIKFEEGSINTIFTPHASELKSSSISVTDDSVAIDTRNFSVALRDSLNVVRLTIDASSQSLRVTDGATYTTEVSAGIIDAYQNGNLKLSYTPDGLYWYDGTASETLAMALTGAASGGDSGYLMYLTDAAYSDFLGFGNNSNKDAFRIHRAADANNEVLNMTENLHMHDKKIVGVNEIRFGSNLAWHGGNLVVARGVTAVTGGVWTAVSFGKTFSLLPAVALGTSNTTSYPKVRAVTGTGCEVCLDGTASGNVSWVAISFG